MVKERTKSSFAKENIALTKEMIRDVFGRNDLILRRVTRTTDSFGQLSDVTTSDSIFTGDLQVHPNLDERWLAAGIVEVGDAILYIEPKALEEIPSPGDFIVDNVRNAIWEIHGVIESPTLGTSIIHYSYRCKRKIESGDT